MAGDMQLVGVALASDEVEAGMIQGLLADRGIPSVVKPIGVQGPTLGFGWASPGGGEHRVMVGAERLEEARAVLAEALPDDPEAAWPQTSDSPQLEKAGGRGPRDYGLIGAYARIYVFSALAMGGAFAVFLIVDAL